MSGVWLDKELNAKIGLCPPSMAYSTTVPTGNPFHAPKLPIVDRTPVLHIQYILVPIFLVSWGHGSTLHQISASTYKQSRIRAFEEGTDVIY